jgi:radical SAM superfamily enzyme YgiQ (UPF0313 family)
VHIPLIDQRTPAPAQGSGGKLTVTFVRAPIVCSEGSINNEATPSIAFAYLSAYVKAHGYRTHIVDGIAEGLNRLWPLPKYPGFMCHGEPFEELIARIPSDSDVIAFSGMFSGEWPVLRDLILMVHERFPKALYVIGGEHATAVPEYTLRDCPPLDVVVRGEGEHTLYELLEAYGGSGDYSMVGGISFLDESGAYHENGNLPRIRDANTIPWPDWPEGYLEKFWEAGKSYGVSTARDMPFMASRGCPYSCTFCSNPQMWTTRYVLRSPEDCIAEIRSYVERYNITSLQFYDLTAIIKRDWILDFCTRLLKEDFRVSWSLPSGTRSEVLDREALRLIKESGCSYLVYAPESGSAETLAKIKKKVKLDRLEDSVLEARRQGIVVRTNLIIGFPSETRRQVFQTLLWGLKMAVRGVDEVPVFLYNPYPGSELFDELAAQGKVRLSDDYFFVLTSINGKYISSQSVSYNPHIGAVELVFWRTLFMGANYLVSYLLYPARIVRTLRSLFSPGSSTVLEHRLKDALRRHREERASA